MEKKYDSKYIQTILFPVKKWTVQKAEKWLDEHSMKHDKVHTTEEFHRFR
jgi:hypothetical protein